MNKATAMLDDLHFMVSATRGHDSYVIPKDQMKGLIDLSRHAIKLGGIMYKYQHHYFMIDRHDAIPALEELEKTVEGLPA